MTNNHKFVWNDSYSVKVPVLDEQHKKFFDIAKHISDLPDNRDYSSFRKSLILTIVELARYALNSLSYEEEFLIKHNCNECEEHCAFHDRFREKVKDLLKRACDEKEDIHKLSDEVSAFAENWITYHIAYVDKKCIDNMIIDKANNF